MVQTKLTKVYAVEFMNYTNSTQATVERTLPREVADYLNLGSEAVLIKEEQIDEFKNYGGGFRSLKFIGNVCEIIEEEEERYGYNT